ncbi:MAG TPA: heparinase II/III family protein [Aggregatilineaceae bacterium]|nr:heparinase II/III family protein [Aggregatilineaceae bacterium]
MTVPSKDQLKRWLNNPAPITDLRVQVRQSPTTQVVLDAMRQEIDDLNTIPTLSYSLYRMFEQNGVRGPYETAYFLKRAQLTRAVLEYVMGDTSMRDVIHDVAWDICEETSWLLPAHEEQGPAYWDLNLPVRTTPFGAHTMLTREPDSIDLFAAETGAALAETIYLVGDDLNPEVRQRMRQEVERHVFKPYLAYARDHWWFKGALNWNGVCNGSIALAFLRLEKDTETLAEALALALEGFEAYIATGFEADGGSIEGLGYWNYGLMYYITVAELLREITNGELDLLANPRLRAIAAYPPGMLLSAPNNFINFGDSTETQTLSAGVVNRLAERTGVGALSALLIPVGAETYKSEAGHTAKEFSSRFGYNFYSKLPSIFRYAAWWDCTQPATSLIQQDFILPDTGVIKLVGKTKTGKTVLLVTKAGHNDGHHSHTDIGTFIINVDGESLLPDPGRGLYSKEYFRQARYDNVFNNSYSHSVPRFGGKLQSPGPEFGGQQQFYGTIVDYGQREKTKYTVVDFQTAYDLPELHLARRTLELDTETGQVTLSDEFEFAGAALPVEEAFSTWSPVEISGSVAQITGERASLTLEIIEPAGAVFALESLAEACRENKLEESLVRLSVVLPDGAHQFKLQITPQ